MTKDWQRIERDYRLGRTLATENRVSPSTISRRVHKEERVQDKTVEIRVRIRAALMIKMTQMPRNTPRNKSATHRRELTSKSL